MKNFDEVESKFKAHRLELLKEKNKRTLEKKMAKNWIEKRRRKSELATENCSEGPKKIKVAKSTCNTKKPVKKNKSESDSSYTGSSASGLSDSSESDNPNVAAV